MKKEAVTSLVYEVRGTLRCEFESLVLLWSAVVRMNANCLFYCPCTSSEYQLRILSMGDILDTIGWGVDITLKIRF